MPSVTISKEHKNMLIELSLKLSSVEKRYSQASLTEMLIEQQHKKIFKVTEKEKDTNTIEVPKFSEK